jgi:hypothetical protein
MRKLHSHCLFFFSLHSSGKEIPEEFFSLQFSFPFTTNRIQDKLKLKFEKNEKIEKN